MRLVGRDVGLYGDEQAHDWTSSNREVRWGEGTEGDRDLLLCAPQ
jgi:hypothetical protein